MANDPRPQSEPGPDPSPTSKPGRILSMSAADPDAITVDESWRRSYISTSPLNYGEVDMSAAERCDTSVAPKESPPINANEVEPPPTGIDSPGYKHMEILASNILPIEKVIILAFIVVLATVHSLDNFLRVLYQFEVTMDLGRGGYLAAVNTISTLATATLTPMISKSADVFGRPQTLFASVVSYVIGTALQAGASRMPMFCTGTVFWTIGFLGVISMFEIIIADITSMRLRVMMFYLPAVPYLATTWISAPLRDSLVKACTWQWRFAWSAIIYTACSLPLLIALFIIERRANKRIPPSEDASKPKKKALLDTVALRFQQMDILGWFLSACIVTLVLAPWPAVAVIQPTGDLTWKGPPMIAGFSVGLFCIPLFYFVEKRAKFPLFPRQLLAETRILVALAMGFLYHMAYYVQHTYLYIGLLVRYDESPDAAARITGLYTFTSTFLGLFMGVIMSMNRDLRWYLRLGAIFYLVAFVVQILHPSGIDNTARLSVTCAQLLLGFAGGLFPFPAMAFVQATREHAHLATLIGAYMTACRVGGGIGQALAGAVWINVLQPSLRKAFSGPGGLPEDAINAAFQAPTDFNVLYPFGSGIRAIANEKFIDTHRILCAIGIIASTLLIILAFFIRDASLEGPEQEDIGIELWAPSGENRGLKETFRTGAAPSPLLPSRLPILM